jgi:hypothetical protein
MLGRAWILGKMAHWILKILSSVRFFSRAGKQFQVNHVATVQL